MIDSVRLDRNLTVRRLPAELQGEKTIRMVVWELIYIRDQDQPAKTVMDIMEGTPAQLIRIFNSNRKCYAPGHCEVTLAKVGGN